MRTCEQCRNMSNCANEAIEKGNDFRTDFEGEEYCSRFMPPMTNGDRIRAMSDEELAWELMRFRFDAYGKASGDESVLPDSQQKIAEWLKQPCEVDHDAEWSH